jgi:hypothetical protein
LRLSSADWLIVAAVLLTLIGFGPTAWQQFEKLEPGADYRMPYELGSITGSTAGTAVTCAASHNRS